jgi:hypothetical protein
MRWHVPRLPAVSQALPGLLLSLFGAVLVSGALGAGCGGATRSTPRIGGESHFLHWCNGSCDEPGLECISGLCTSPCVVAEPNACSALPPASCTDQSIEPGAVAICDVACHGNADCTVLGDEFACDGSFCRVPASPSTSELADASNAGATSLGSEGEITSAGGNGGTDSAGPNCLQCLPVSSLEWIDYGAYPLPMPWPHSVLSPCGGYTHELTIDIGTPFPTPRCSAPLECPSDAIAALDAILSDPAFPSSGSTLTKLSYGLPVNDYENRLMILLPRPGPPRAYNPDEYPALALFVGAPCGGTAGCDEIPPLIDNLVRQLRAIDALELLEPECATAFPNGPEG